jgi:glycosyltransferase involved in cell wall biosynthesis
MKLSICIPTYNRAYYLKNCLHSINLSALNTNYKFQVCISDNNSTDETYNVVQEAQSLINIKYCKNQKNIGRVKNYLNVVDMADGEFVWLLGDDDLLMPNAIETINNLIFVRKNIDFFYINSNNLSIEYINKFNYPFDTINLPVQMDLFSKWKVSGEMSFMNLINPKISFDFLGGMFLSVFRKQMWSNNLDILNYYAINDNRTFSHFDNTFPHIKIFAKAFSKSSSYFNSAPQSVCVSGVREWSLMSPFVNSVRLVEALKEYRNNGLSKWRYYYCKNYALRYSMIDIIKIIIYKNSGYEFINNYKLLLTYLLYPNFYLSPIYFIISKIFKVKY